jgi:hypothetical protein
MHKYTNCYQFINIQYLINILVPSIRVELPARPAPVRASIRATSDVTTATADRDANFCTNRTTEASPKMLLLAAIHRGSLAFPDRFLYGCNAVIS